MGSSGMVMAPNPSQFRLLNITLPLIAVGVPYSTTVDWDSPFTAGRVPAIDECTVTRGSGLIGKATVTVTDMTATSCSYTVTATALVLANAPITIMAWA